jgi:hypothetical protein
VSEFENEPIRGLPGQLPPGERIIWQGAPSFRGLALGAFRIREVAVYFAVLGAAKAVDVIATGGPWSNAVLEFVGMAAPATLAIAVLSALALLCQRTTVYTITNRRLVLRFGMALTKAVNLPFVVVESATMKVDSAGCGDIALGLKPDAKVGYVALWPHVRPWRLARPQPSLRGLNDASRVASLLAVALAEANGMPAPAAPQPDRTPTQAPAPIGVTQPA